MTRASTKLKEAGQPSPQPKDLPGYRILPHNMEAEQGLLGALLVDNRAMDARADVFATGGRCKPPGEADGKCHPRPEFSPPSAEGPLRERNVNHGDKINAILIEGHRSSTLSIYNINLLMRREAVECVSNGDNIPK